MLKLKNTQNKNYYYLLALIAILTFSNFIYTGFSTNDDYEYYTRYFNDTNVWKSSYEYAKSNGRFYFTFMQPIFNILIPYCFNSIFVTKIINLFIIFIGAIIFAYNLKCIFKNKTYSYLFILFYLVFVTIKGPNNPIVSYPFYFSTSWVLFQLSVYFFIKYLEKNYSKFKFMSLFFYVFSLLFYEMYLLYSVLFFFLTFISYNKFNDNKTFSNLFSKNNLFIYANVVYITIYFIFKKNFSTEMYDGVNINEDFKFYSFAQALFYLTKGALPLHLYFSGHGVYENYSYILGGHTQNIFNPIMHIKVEWLLKSIIVATLLVIISKKYKPTNFFDRKQKIILFILSLLLIFIPHFLLALTVKYQYYTNMGMDNYITTYFSSFIFYSWLIYITCFILSIKSNLIKNTVFTLFVIIVSYSSILIDYSNFHAKKDLEKIYNFFESIDYLTTCKEFEIVKENSIIIAPDLFKVNSNISYYNCCSFDLKHYFKAKTKKTFIFPKDSIVIDKVENTDTYYLSYKTTKNGYYFLMSKKNGNETKLFIRSTKNVETINIFDKDSIIKNDILLKNKDKINVVSFKNCDHNKFVIEN